MNEPADADPTNARNLACASPKGKAAWALGGSSWGSQPGPKVTQVGGHVCKKRSFSPGIVTPDGLYHRSVVVPTGALSSPFVCSGNGVISVLVICCDSWRVTGGARSL